MLLFLEVVLTLAVKPVKADYKIELVHPHKCCIIHAKYFYFRTGWTSNLCAITANERVYRVKGKPQNIIHYFD